jgi:serine/threonine-protein kinase
MTSSASDPRVGVVLQDRYRILERIATGAMGAIYRAERLKLGRAVAVKFLDVSFDAAADELLRRFEREARAMSRLGHPHCVSVIDFGVADAPYIVMEYVTGTTLEQLIDWGPVAPARALNILRQVLAGLAHAHRQEIIHRDIKPANIMLTEATGTGDHARILDFGLAKLLDVAPRDLSTAKLVLGTPSYMSPEQSLGRPVDARSDLYSVAVVAFELLTGEKPFADPDKMETLRMHREEPPPRLADVAPALHPSEQLERVISRALAKRPADRFASAIDFAAALDSVPEAKRSDRFALTDEAGDHTAPVAPAGHRRTLAGAAALALVAAAAAWLWWPRPPGAGGESFPPRSPGARGVATRAGQGAAVAADGGAGPTLAAAVAADAGAGARADAGSGEDAEAEPELPPEEILVGVAANGADGAVRDLDDVRALIAAGRREEAITGLRLLARRNPNSAAVPYLLGNLYLDKRWTIPALEAYQDAVSRNPVYGRNTTLIRRVIDALESPSAHSRASALLRSIGKPALPQLEKAAERHRSRTVRERAARLVGQLSRRGRR